jgi:hypothetical protein
MSRREPGDGLPETHVDAEQLYRPQSRSSFCTAPTTLGLGGILGLLGRPDMAAGFAAIGGAALVWAAIYTILYRSDAGA